MAELFASVANQCALLRESLPLPGRKSFHVLVIRTWNERLDHLTKENRYLDALALGCDFFKDQGKTLVGLKGPKEKRKTVIAQKLISILLKFLDVIDPMDMPPQLGLDPGDGHSMIVHRLHQLFLQRHPV